MVTMTFDFEALQKAVHAELVALSEKEDEESALSAAIRAYLKATNSVLVPRAKRDSAVALLMGLSLYWHEQGDVSQSRHVESVAKALTQESE